MSQNVIQSYRFGADNQITNLDYNDDITGNKAVGWLRCGYLIESGHELIGKEITSLWFRIKKKGTMTAGVMSAYAGGTLIGSVDATALPADFEYVEFTGTNTHTLVADESLWVTVSETLTTTWSIRVQLNASSDYWGNGNTEGTTDAGATKSGYSETGSIADPTTPPANPTGIYTNPPTIKVNYS